MNRGVHVNLTIAVAGMLSEDGGKIELQPVADAAVIGARDALVVWAAANLEKGKEPMVFTCKVSLVRLPVEAKEAMPAEPEKH